MSISHKAIYVNFHISHPPKLLLSETLYDELSKNLVICFKGILASLLPDTSFKFKARISPWLLKLQSQRTFCKHPKPSCTNQNHTPKNIYNHPKLTITTRNHPQSARIHLDLDVTGLTPSISM